MGPLKASIRLPLQETDARTGSRAWKQFSQIANPGTRMARALRPNQEVRLLRCRSKADSPDFREVGGVRLKPIRRVGRRLREIELNGTGIMVGLRQGHQARANEQEHQESGRGSGRECKPSRELRRVRRTHPSK